MLLRQASRSLVDAPLAVLGRRCRRSLALPLSASTVSESNLIKFSGGKESRFITLSHGGASGASNQQPKDLPESRPGRVYERRIELESTAYSDRRPPPYFYVFRLTPVSARVSMSATNLTNEDSDKADVVQTWLSLALREIHNSPNLDEDLCCVLRAFGASDSDAWGAASLDPGRWCRRA